MARRRIIPYNPSLKEVARRLRNHSTLAEILLWRQIKDRQLRGHQFLRQKPLDNFIVDFFCYELMLAIEIDGESHNDRVEEDQTRQQRLESLGVRFLRFYDDDVKNNMEGVLARLDSCIKDCEELGFGRANPPLIPPQGGTLMRA